MTLTLRRPAAEDAVALHQLVASCPPLDGNSLYCNLLHCTHFRATSVAALARGGRPDDAERLVGFIAAYIPPEQPDTLFVWQVAVAAGARQQGLGSRMLDALLRRPACRGVRYVDSTINPGNKASRALFESWARRHRARTSSHLRFERERHFGGAHEDEFLMRIGPFALAAEAAV